MKLNERGEIVDPQVMTQRSIDPIEDRFWTYLREELDDTAFAAWLYATPISNSPWVPKITWPWLSTLTPMMFRLTVYASAPGLHVASSPSCSRAAAYASRYPKTFGQP